jgi:hypothetical protein
VTDQPITGYRTLRPEEIALINAIKARAQDVADLVDRLYAGSNDPRWIAIGKTNLQQGFMALVRSVAQPESF